MESYILEVLSDEKERALRMINGYKKEVEHLARGSISIKKINGKNYHYLIYRNYGKKMSDYIKSDDLEEIKKQLNKRSKLLNIIKKLELDIDIMEHAIKYGNQQLVKIKQIV